MECSVALVTSTHIVYIVVKSSVMATKRKSHTPRKETGGHLIKCKQSRNSQKLGNAVKELVQMEHLFKPKE